MRCRPSALGLPVLTRSLAALATSSGLLMGPVLLGGCEQLGIEPPRFEAPENLPTVVLPDEIRIARATVATTRLDVEEAAKLLEGTTGPQAAYAKARLAIYRADCEGAMSHLSTTAASQVRGAMAIADLARRCHGATTGAAIVDDHDRGIWLRVQDEADLVLAPLLIDVADRARAALTRDLGVELPRPLRIDLVRDLFSLSAVSGLGVDAAETTGTVAVARWGRVTIVSPRAPREGYPWADTMAHELTHLMLSRASADHAPLWLQEGIAKIEEERWRDRRAFDGEPNSSQVAIDAARKGQSVGITKIGPSIAMLPSAAAASIAFAEVSSFMEFWIEKNGRRALSMLLRDLAEAPDADSAMRGVSGLSVGDWEVLWRTELETRFAPLVESQPDDPTDGYPGWLIGRSLRAAELMSNAGHDDRAAQSLAAELDQAPHFAALRFAAARSARNAKWAEVSELLGTVDDVDSPHGGFLALRGLLDQEDQSSTGAHALTRHGLSLDPLLIDVACAAAEAEHSRKDLHKLCEQVKSLPRRGQR